MTQRLIKNVLRAGLLNLVHVQVHELVLNLVHVQGTGYETGRLQPQTCTQPGPGHLNLNLNIRAESRSQSSIHGSIICSC